MCGQPDGNVTATSAVEITGVVTAATALKASVCGALIHEICHSDAAATK